MCFYRKSIYAIMAVMAAVGCVACSDELAAPGGSEIVADDDYFIISRGSEAQSRVSYPDEKSAVFEDGDEVGGFALNSDGTPVAGEKANARYKVKNKTMLGGGTGRQVLEPMSADDKLGQGHAHYLFYYPYSPDITSPEQVTAYDHTVQSNQNATGAYEMSDLLWDMAEPDPTQNCVNVAMDHAMAQIIVHLDEEFIDAKKDVVLSGVSLTASGMDLRTESVDELNYTAGKTGDVAMWYYGYATSGALMYKAVVAACTVLPKGMTLLTVTTSDGVKKSYKLRDEVSLRPGKNYIFSLKKNAVEIPVVDDTDSWVLDVLDPETGEPVGLLCREYLHYVDPAGITGTEEPYTGTPYGDTKTVNSQAWVFYHLQPGTNIPDLDKGTVVWFVYDIRDMNQYFRWPAPHINKNQKGVFSPRHGWKWGGITAEGYGCELPGSEQQYYMHGGTVEWNGTDNKIEYFRMPEQKITNAQAAKGFIAIDRATGEVSVKYGETDPAAEKQGVIVQHMLIDRRVNKKDGTMEIRKYPIVKIGYNQFWMSMSLRTQVFCDGTPIKCYNKKGSPGVTFNDGDLLEAGYIFPFNTLIDEPYDPYNIVEQRSHPESKYTPTRLYNKPTVDNPKFLPVSPDDYSYYIMPGRKEITNFLRYVNPFFAAKMASKYVAQFNGDGHAYGSLETSLRGESGLLSAGSSTYQNAYTCNVSGFNLRPLGRTEPMTSLNYCVGLNQAATLIVNSASEPDAVLLFTIQNYNPFDGGQTADVQAYNYPGMTNRITEVFAQVRFVMKYRNQADTQGRSKTRGTETDGSEAAARRDVHIFLDE